MNSELKYKCSVEAVVEEKIDGVFVPVKSFKKDNLLLNLGKKIILQRMFGLTSSLPYNIINRMFYGTKDEATAPLDETNTISSFSPVLGVNNLGTPVLSGNSIVVPFVLEDNEFNGYTIRSIGIGCIHGTSDYYPMNRVLLDGGNEIEKTANIRFSGVWTITISEEVLP